MTLSPTKKHIPIRTCLGCRVKKDKKLLIRVIKTENQEIIDSNHKLQARAYYFCSEDCKSKYNSKYNKGKRS